MARKLKKVSNLKNRSTAGGSSPFYDGAKLTVTNNPFGYENDNKQVYVVFPCSGENELWLQMLLKSRSSADDRLISPLQTTDDDLKQLREFCKNAGKTTDSQLEEFDRCFGFCENWQTAEIEVVRPIDEATNTEFITIKVLSSTAAPADADADAAADADNLEDWQNPAIPYSDLSREQKIRRTNWNKTHDKVRTDDPEPRA